MIGRVLGAALLAAASAASAQEHDHHSPAPVQAQAQAQAHADHDAAAGQNAPDDPATAAAEPVGDAAPPPVPRDHAADALWGSDAMAEARRGLAAENGAFAGSMLLIDRFERQVQAGRDGYRLDARAWIGGDLDRLVIKAEGEGRRGRPLERAELQLLYDRAISPYFNLHAGARHDFTNRPRSYAALGIEGLAPYWLDVQGTLFLSTSGELSARVEGSFDQRLTQRWVLQPRAELNVSAARSRASDADRGVSDVELGLRLRYELSREFAPYFGVEWARTLGRAPAQDRAAGEAAGSVRLLAGMRFSF